MSNKPLVLVVDDDVDLGSMLQLILNGGGYQTHVASSGSEALRWLERNQPDLVLLDIMMPDVSGFTVLRQIRSRHSDGEMPVVLVTAFADDQTESQGASAGANSLLRKPLRPRELLDHLGKLVQTSR